MVFSIASLASAQFTTIGPFSGNAGSEGFDYQNTPTAFPTCVEDRVFHDQADLCGLNGGFAHITGSWGFGCSIYPNNTPRLFGGSNHVMYTFDDTVTKFGGYFGTNNPTAGDGHIIFYDASGTVLYQDVIVAPNDCTWTWNGWDSGGVPVKSIECYSNYSSGGYLNMDDMEAEIGGGAPGTAYCFGNTAAGNPCPCGNDGTDPVAGCAHDDSAQGALLSASGLPSITNDTLVFQGNRGPISNTSLFFQANNNLDGMGNFLGDGIRCAGGSLIRLKVKITDVNGDADSTPAVITTRSAAFGHPIAAGETLYYQWWFRDAFGSPCGNESNTSNGYMITWLP